jgi:DNA-binding NtrC family response regulator
MNYVLIVSADPDLMRALSITVQAEGYLPFTATSAQAARRLLETFKNPIVVVVDASRDQAECLSLVQAIPAELALQQHRAYLILNGGPLGFPNDVQTIITQFQLNLLHLPFLVEDFLALLAAEVQQLSAPPSP